MRKYFVKQQKLLGQINGHVEEMITSYQVLDMIEHQHY